MTYVEGKLKVWVKGGKFEFHNDLYVKVMIDDRLLWKTEEADSFSPSWDATATRHVKGEFEKLQFALMDEDTFSRDDLLGTCSIPFSCLLNPVFNKLERTEFDGEINMVDAEGEKIGVLRVCVEYMPGHVGFFKMMGERFHKDQDE